MEEKKLTDEEVIRLLEIFAKPDDEPDWIDGLAKMALDLIHRLQGENEKLSDKNATLEYENSELKQRVSILETDNDDYKNKIAENELVSIDWHYSQVEELEEKVERYGHRLSETQYALSVCQDENAELLKLCEKTNGEMDKMRDEKDKQLLSQKAEIERLKRYEMTESEFQKYCAYKIIEPQIRGCLDRERELQKQVDELKEQRDNQAYIAEELVQEKHRWTEQAVKDTSKEIFDEIYHKNYEIDVQVKDYEMHEEAIDIVGKAILKAINERMRAVAKRYGVEVE